LIQNTVYLVVVLIPQTVSTRRVIEQIGAGPPRGGGIRSFEVKGDLQLKILDRALSKVKLHISANNF